MKTRNYLDVSLIPSKDYSAIREGIKNFHSEGNKSAISTVDLELGLNPIKVSKTRKMSPCLENFKFNLSKDSIEIFERLKVSISPNIPIKFLSGFIFEGFNAKLFLEGVYIILE